MFSADSGANAGGKRRPSWPERKGSISAVTFGPRRAKPDCPNHQRMTSSGEGRNRFRVARIGGVSPAPLISLVLISINFLSQNTRFDRALGPLTLLSYDPAMCLYWSQTFALS